MTQTRQRGQLPGWLAGMIILICLAGCGYVVYLMSKAPEPKQMAVVVDSPSQRGRPQAPPPDRITPRGNNGFRVQAGNAIMDVQKPARGEPTFNFYFTRQALSADDWAWLEMRRSVIDARSPSAVVMELSADQIAQLQKIARVPPMILDDADRSRMTALWAAYDGAEGDAKNQAERELLLTWREIAGKALQPTRQAVASAAAEVRKVVSAEQFEKYQQWRSRQLSTPPATRPAAGPANRQGSRAAAAATTRPSNRAAGPTTRSSNRPTGRTAPATRGS